MSDRQRHRPPVDIPPTSAGTDDRPVEHDHPLPRPLVWAAAALVVGILAGLLLLAAYAYSITSRLNQVEAYIADRGQQRDSERDQLQDDFRTAVCEVLDSLPADDALTDLRVRYGCGPGLTQEQQP